MGKRFACQNELYSSQMLQKGNLMIPVYEQINDNLRIFKEKGKHIPPHLHKSIECVYVLEGGLELGIGEELYHMNEGDFAIIFPELIHHYQVFDASGAKACYLMVLPALGGNYLNELQRKCPENPIIRKEKIHPDIVYAITVLMKEKKNTNRMIEQAFFQIILARSMPCFQLIDKEEAGSDDLVYRAVSYISANFRESISLSGMAKALGVSKYVLSRVFSKTFHRNFNQYLNETRLDYACALLQYSSETITDIAMDSGFESQRTFNRVFRERFHKSPREYRRDTK